MKRLASYLNRLDRFPEIISAARRLRPFVPLTLEYLEAKPLAYPLEADLPGGVHVRLMETEEVKILWHIFVRHCYRVSGHESVILDLGANIGLFTLYAATAAPRARTYSAEPVPSTFSRLMQHLEANGLTGRVFPLNSAITAVSGQRHIADERAPAGAKAPVG
jgi:hypothetical protein